MKKTRSSFATIAKRRGSQEQPLAEMFTPLVEQQQQEGEADPTQQQQQQQQQQTPADPFEGLDLDELPEAYREAAKTARTQITANAAEIAKAREFQSKADIAERQLAEMRQQQQQQTSVQQQQQEDPMEKLMRENYEANNIDPKAIPGLIKINLPMFKAHAEMIKAEVTGGFKPLVESHMGQLAEHAFLSARADDPHGLLENEAVAAAVWARIQEIGNTQQVTKELVQNLARIKHFDHNPTGTPTIVNTQAPNTVTFQGTRLSVPGSGSAPANRKNSSPVSLPPDLQVALAETQKNWPTPKAGKR